jgi:hypothetical protein
VLNLRHGFWKGRGGRGALLSRGRGLVGKTVLKPTRHKKEPQAGGGLGVLKCYLFRASCECYQLVRARLAFHLPKTYE